MSPRTGRSIRARDYACNKGHVSRSRQVRQRSRLAGQAVRGEPVAAQLKIGVAGVSSLFDVIPSAALVLASLAVCINSLAPQGGASVGPAAFLRPPGGPLNVGGKTIMSGNLVELAQWFVRLSGNWT